MGEKQDVEKNRIRILRTEAALGIQGSSASWCLLAALREEKSHTPCYALMPHCLKLLCKVQSLLQIPGWMYPLNTVISNPKLFPGFKRCLGQLQK